MSLMCSDEFSINIFQLFCLSRIISANSSADLVGSRLSRKASTVRYSERLIFQSAFSSNSFTSKILFFVGFGCVGSETGSGKETWLLEWDRGIWMRQGIFPWDRARDNAALAVPCLYCGFYVSDDEIKTIYSPLHILEYLYEISCIES